MAKPESSPEEDVLPEAAADPKPAIVQAAATTTSDEPISIPKPTKSALDMFKSTRDPSIAGVETLLTALPHCRISDAEDWTRLHPNEDDYWSTELCFVNVPIKGQKRDTLHLIDEDLAMQLSAERKNPALPLGARDQAPRRLLPVPRPERRTSTTRWNDVQLAGVRAGQDSCGCRRPAAKARRRRGLQDRPMPATRTLSPSRNGRRSRSTS